MNSINYLSIALASVTPMVIGFIYYHPKLFGTAWMKSLGLTEEDLKKGNMAVIFGVSLLLSCLLSFFLLNFNNDIGQEGEFDTFAHGAWHGMFIGVLVATPVLVTNGLFERKNAKNLLINVGYWILTLAIMGGIVDVMNHWGN